MKTQLKKLIAKADKISTLKAPGKAKARDEAIAFAKSMIKAEDYGDAKTAYDLALQFNGGKSNEELAVIHKQINDLTDGGATEDTLPTLDEQLAKKQYQGGSRKTCIRKVLDAHNIKYLKGDNTKYIEERYNAVREGRKFKAPAKAARPKSLQEPKPKKPQTSRPKVPKGKGLGVYVDSKGTRVSFAAGRDTLVHNGRRYTTEEALANQGVMEELIAARSPILKFTKR